MVHDNGIAFELHIELSVNGSTIHGTTLSMDERPTRELIASIEDALIGKGYSRDSFKIKLIEMVPLTEAELEELRTSQARGMH